VDGAHYCTARIDRVAHCPHDDSSSSGVQPCTTSAYVNQSINSIRVEGLGARLGSRVCGSNERSSLSSRKEGNSCRDLSIRTGIVQHDSVDWMETANLGSHDMPR